MRLAIVEGNRPAIVAPDGNSVRVCRPDAAWHAAAAPFGAGWWTAMCSQALSRPCEDDLEEPIPVQSVRLQAPVLLPSKVIACASNYEAHVEEMRETVLPRTNQDAPSWLLHFDVFLKAPSSIVGPQDSVRIPPVALEQELKVHHECELAIVIGRPGRAIRADKAYEHVFGYLPALDMTVRGAGDRSRRKSYDTFTPVGPWLTTADEVPEPHDLQISLRVNGEQRQVVNTASMVVQIPEIIEYASSVMTLNPGDLILTGAPPGVGPVIVGDRIECSISDLGRMTVPVVADPTTSHADGRPA